MIRVAILSSLLFFALAQAQSQNATTLYYLDMKNARDIEMLSQYVKNELIRNDASEQHMFLSNGLKPQKGKGEIEINDLLDGLSFFSPRSKNSYDELKLFNFHLSKDVGIPVYFSTNKSSFYNSPVEFFFILGKLDLYEAKEVLDEFVYKLLLTNLFVQNSELKDYITITVVLERDTGSNQLVESLSSHYPYIKYETY